MVSTVKPDLTGVSKVSYDASAQALACTHSQLGKLNGKYTCSCTAAIDKNGVRGFSR